MRCPSRRLAFRLALAMGEPDPDAMLRRMPGRLWSEWVAYWNAEPWGEERADHRAAMLAELLHVGFGLRPRRRRADFLIKPPPRARQSREEMGQVFAAMVAAGLGREVKK